MPQKPTKTAQDAPNCASEGVELYKAKIIALEARIESLKAQNKQFKETIRQMDRRIMKGKL